MLSEFQRGLVDDTMVPYMIRREIKLTMSGYQVLSAFKNILQIDAN